MVFTTAHAERARAREGGTRFRVASMSAPASVVQYDAQEGAVDLEWELPVVLDEAQLLEFVQKEIHPRARRADHLRERFLGDLRDHADRLVLLPVPRQQQQRPR